jgi:hypothetical protein
VRTKLSTCNRKRRFRSERDALAVALDAAVPLRPYPCDRCWQFHLTSRTKGKRQLRALNKSDRPEASSVA